VILQVGAAYSCSICSAFNCIMQVHLILFLGCDCCCEKWPSYLCMLTSTT